MLAIELGWDAFLAGVAAFDDTRAALLTLPFFH
jgi:hypothetical protein